MSSTASEFYACRRAAPGGTAGREQVLAAYVEALRWGFQLTARLGDGKRQAGTLTSSDTSTQVLCSTPPFVVQAPALEAVTFNLLSSVTTADAAFSVAVCESVLTTRTM